MWVRVEDANVRHVWLDEDGNKYYVSPDYYEENGEPCDGETGEILKYSHTEIYSETK